MTSSSLLEDLRPVLDRYGPEPVDQTLRIIERHGLESVRRASREICLENNRENGRDTNSPRHRQKAKHQPSKSKPTAVGYVNKMELHNDKRAAMTAVAEQFENCSFLPTIGEVRQFWIHYDLGQPAPKSRAAAIPRVLTFVSTMDTEEINRMLSSGFFSGPTRLGPISDAIKGKRQERFSKTEAQSSGALAGTHETLVDNTKIRGETDSD